MLNNIESGSVYVNCATVLVKNPTKMQDYSGAVSICFYGVSISVDPGPSYAVLYLQGPSRSRPLVLLAALPVTLKMVQWNGLVEPISVVWIKSLATTPLHLQADLHLSCLCFAASSRESLQLIAYWLARRYVPSVLVVSISIESQDLFSAFVNTEAMRAINQVLRSKEHDIIPKHLLREGKKNFWDIPYQILTF